jgi:hypothetical protein
MQDAEFVKNARLEISTPFETTLECGGRRKRLPRLESIILSSHRTPLRDVSTLEWNL